MKLSYLLSVFLIAFVSYVYASVEENNIDVNIHQKHRNHKKHRHHNRRFKHRRGMHRNRGVRVRTTHSSFIHSYEDYDVRVNDKIAFNVTAKVGDSVILNCAINSSYGVNPGVPFFL